MRRPVVIGAIRGRGNALPPARVGARPASVLIGLALVVSGCGSSTASGPAGLASADASGALVATPSRAGSPATRPSPGGSSATPIPVIVDSDLDADDLRALSGVGVADDNISAEWNVFADPAAWQRILEAGLHPTMVTLDATAAVPVTDAVYLELSANRDAPAARLVFDLFEADPSLLMTQQFFWDSLAAVAAFEPSVIATREATVRIVQDPGPEHGRLVDDRAGSAASIATTADAAAFRTSFLFVLNGGAAIRPVPDPDVSIALTFDGKTCRGAVPASIGLGYVAVEFDNRSTATAVAGLLLLADGVTAKEVEDAFATDPDSVALKLGRSIVGVEAEPRSTSSEVGIATRGGNAIAACVAFDPAPRLAIAGTPTITP